MSSMGIVICNYNKSSYVVNCIQSVLESTIQDFDIYVVDNASTDDSVAQIESHFCLGNTPQVTILQNHENLGGSGGFNTGIRVVLEKGYPYLLCLDNDVLVDENAIAYLRTFLESHPEVGSVGARVYHMEDSDCIQQSGINLDIPHFSVETLYADTPDDGSIPEVLYCDTVATCCVMLRTDILRSTKVGIMPEDNFIYWDDMEWGYRINQAGYKVAVYGKAQVLHSMGARDTKKYAFTSYYNWRNRIHFFLKYTPSKVLDTMSVCLLENVFDTLYECLYREEHHMMKTIHFAFTDALYQVRGKADPNHIPSEVPSPNDEKLSGILENKTSYYIDYDSQSLKNALRLTSYIEETFPHMKKAESKTFCDVSFTFCDYIMHVTDFSLDTIYIDDSFSMLTSPEDIQMIRNYTYCKSLFLYMNQPTVLDAARKIQAETI